MDVDSEMRRGLVRLPPGSEMVTDADEEVFILYSKSTPSSNELRGLGYLDSHKDTLTLSFELKPPTWSNSGTGKQKRKLASRVIQDKTVEIQLAQDKTALRTRAGDTGSVVWRASVDFAQLILQQHHAKSPTSIFDEGLRDARVLELGSGTGLLGIALSPLVGHYTATDIAELLPLIRKNMSLNFPGWPHVKQGTAAEGRNISAFDFNWETLLSTPASRRSQLFPLPASPFDIVLIVDCIYHPTLLPPLLGAMDYVSTAGTTVVVVVMELRAEDVTREFLEGWLRSGEWEVWRMFVDAEFWKDTPYVMWVGWKGHDGDSIPLV
ncbi:putative methyltransferase-domain-containing protein [Mycena alexandri]|uniref:Methyltransferase-domain-containing protein n=1 Tax=Mycena alexandri TaxID=1745969 RepID=A0AAD6X902_9AGAR|nr:putative methyltransferase-domain-containing protein [Mycena alexandri]